MTQRFEIDGISFHFDSRHALFLPEAGVLGVALRREPVLFEDWDSADVRDRVDQLVGHYDPFKLVVLTVGSEPLPTFAVEPVRVGDGGLRALVEGGVRFALSPTEFDGPQVIAGGTFSLNEPHLVLPWLVGAEQSRAE